ncbi:MAG: chemotaxis protein MotB [Alphaproteobacteria bacterium]|nr:MAG: chemotaxis protein MotB [Alphaproteobacteria bacterium]
MASTDNEIPAPIIIKKVKKYAHGHHGGAWKVAYADFVTAMMAFFLLMWLLNVTTKEEKNAISNYFDPTHPKVSASQSGAGGILGGLTVTFEGAMTSDRQAPTTPPDATTPNTGSAIGDQENRTGAEDHDSGSDGPQLQNEKTDDPNHDSKEDSIGNGLNILDEAQKVEVARIQELKEKLEAEQDETFEGIKQKIFEEIEKTPELADLKDHLMIDITPEGLRIQIIDKEGRSMFPSGKAAMFGFMSELVKKVTQVISPQPNQISMRGHTDGIPYPKGAAYDNWNLSADRALATRSVMIQSGLSTSRIENVVGRADREHLLPEEPLSPRNRRISVVLLREKLRTDDEIKDAAKKAGIKSGDDTPKAETDESGEDREDIPELDETVDGDTAITFDDPSEAKPAPNTDIVDEIKKFQDQKNNPAGTATAPEPAQPAAQENVTQTQADTGLEIETEDVVESDGEDFLEF